MTHNKEKSINQNDPDMTKTTRFLDKDITTVITMYYMFKKVGEHISILGRGVEDIKKTQIRCMKKKNTMFEKKNILLGINSRLYRIEEILLIH